MRVIYWKTIFTVALCVFRDAAAPLVNTTGQFQWPLTSAVVVMSCIPLKFQKDFVQEHMFRCKWIILQVTRSPKAEWSRVTLLYVAVSRKGISLPVTLKWVIQTEVSIRWPILESLAVSEDTLSLFEFCLCQIIIRQCQLIFIAFFMHPRTRFVLLAARARSWLMLNLFFHQHPKFPFARAATWPLLPKFMLASSIILSQIQNLAFAFVELHGSDIFPKLLSM